MVKKPVEIGSLISSFNGYIGEVLRFKKNIREQKTINDAIIHPFDPPV